MTSKPSLWVTAGLITVAVALLQKPPSSPTAQTQNLVDSVLKSSPSFRVFASQASPPTGPPLSGQDQSDPGDQFGVALPRSRSGQALSQLPDTEDAEIQQEESSLEPPLVPNHHDPDRPTWNSEPQPRFDQGLISLLQISQRELQGFSK